MAGTAKITFLPCSRREVGPPEKRVSTRPIVLALGLALAASPHRDKCQGLSHESFRIMIDILGSGNAREGEYTVAVRVRHGC